MGTPLIHAHAAAQDRSALGWRMWVPCFGMALCSLLSFLDRQVLAVLSPTILRDTGLSAQDYGNIVFFFFITYTIANPLWGLILDYVGLRIGMLLAVAVWSAASGGHALMSGVAGFALARAVLGLGEGAVVQRRRARSDRHTADRRADRARARDSRARAISVPNPLEKRFWALVFSYAPPAISAGPILTLVPLYLNRALGVSQAELGQIFWIPPFFSAVGYFTGGWAADRYASENPRPIGLMLLLTVAALPFGLTPMSPSLAYAIGLISLSTFVAGAFQMVALKVAAHTYPREQTAMIAGIASGAWSLLNAVLSPVIGRLFDQRSYSEAFRRGQPGPDRAFCAAFSVLTTFS